MSRQLAEREEACLVRRLPRPRAWWIAGRGETCLLVRTPYARSLAHARGGSQDEEKILLPLFTPRPYYVPWLERLSYCLEYICPLVFPPFTYTRPL